MQGLLNYSLGDWKKHSYWSAMVTRKVGETVEAAFIFYHEQSIRIPGSRPRQGLISKEQTGLPTALSVGFGMQ